MLQVDVQQAVTSFPPGQTGLVRTMQPKQAVTAYNTAALQSTNYAD